MEEKIVITKTVGKTSINISADADDAVFMLSRALHIVAKKINDETGIDVNETIEAACASAYLDDDEFDKMMQSINRLRTLAQANDFDEMRKVIDEMEGKHMN